MNEALPRMKFDLAWRELLDGRKSVTRRTGWANLKADDEVLAVKKTASGRERILGTIRVLDVHEELLTAIRGDQGEVAREGFPDKDPEWFIAAFLECHNLPVEAAIDLRVRRIRFAFTPVQATLDFGAPAED